jgi:mRNA interferase YafQ
MKKIVETTSLKKDFKKYYRDERVKNILFEVVSILANGNVLDKKFKNHPMKGKYNNCYDCHILPDLILIYMITKDSIELIRLCSHSELLK